MCYPERASTSSYTLTFMHKKKLCRSPNENLLLSNMNLVHFYTLVPILLKPVSHQTDNWQMPIPFLLFSSAMFDTVSHAFLLTCCVNLASVGRSMLKWVWSFLSDQSQKAPFPSPELATEGLGKVQFLPLSHLISVGQETVTWQRLGKRVEDQKSTYPTKTTRSNTDNETADMTKYLLH